MPVSAPSLPILTGGLLGVSSLPVVGSLLLGSPPGAGALPSAGALPVRTLPGGALPGVGSLPSTSGLPVVGSLSVDSLPSTNRLSIIGYLPGVGTLPGAGSLSVVGNLPSTSGLPVVGSLPVVEALPGARSLPGLGSLPLPCAGTSPSPPDLTGLLSSITQNLPIPSAISSIISSITSILSGVVPSFLFQLPVVQDAGPMLVVLGHLPSLNPSKFGSIAGLGSVSALQSAASGVSPSNVSLIKTLPASSDPTN